MMSERITIEGGQVLLDGSVLCIATGPEAAFVIAWCLNSARSSDWMPSYNVADADERRVQEFFA